MTRLLPLIALQLLTLGAVLWLAFRAPPPPAENPHAARAAELLDAGRFSTARLAFERAAAATTGDPAIAHLDQARRAQALGIISAPTLPTPDRIDDLNALADALEVAFPTDAQMLRLAALRAGGKVTEATALGESLIDASKSPWVRWHLGGLRLRQARTDEAITLLEHVVKAQPTFGAGFHQLGLAYSADKRSEASIGAFQSAIKHGAGHAAELDLGRLFLSQKMWAEALPHLQNSLRARPASAEALRLIAAAHYHLKRYDLAAKTYQRAYAVEPAPRTLLSAAIAFHAGAQHAQSIQLLDRLAPHVPDIPEILFQRALALAALKRPVQPILERYLTFARGMAGEADRIKQAETFLKGPPKGPTAAPPGKMPAPVAPPSGRQPPKAAPSPW